MQTVNLSSYPPLMTIDAVAEAIHVSRRTVFRMLREGDLTRLKLGASQSSKVLIERSELEAYVSGCRRPSSAKGKKR